MKNIQEKIMVVSLGQLDPNLTETKLKVLANIRKEDSTVEELYNLVNAPEHWDRIERLGYSKAQEQVFWYQINHVKYTRIIIFCPTYYLRFVIGESNFTEKIIQHCYYHRKECVIYTTDTINNTTKYIRSEPLASDIQIKCVNTKGFVTNWEPWNKHKTMISDRVRDIIINSNNRISYDNLSFTNTKLIKELNKLGIFPNIPTDTEMEDTLDECADAYSLPELKHAVHNIKNFYANVGSISNRRYEVTCRDVLVEEYDGVVVGDGRYVERQYRTQQTLIQAYLTLQYFEAIGQDIDHDKYVRCPVCGHIYSISEEACLVCDTENLTIVDFESYDILARLQNKDTAENEYEYEDYDEDEDEDELQNEEEYTELYSI